MEKRKPVVVMIGLESEVESSTFHTGKAILRCSASLFNIYQSQTEVTLEEERPRPSSVLGTRDASSGKSNDYSRKFILQIIDERQISEEK